MGKRARTSMRVWAAIGRLLHDEALRLQAPIGLFDHQVITVMPTLTEGDIDALARNLGQADREASTPAQQPSDSDQLGVLLLRGAYVFTPGDKRKAPRG